MSALKVFRDWRRAGLCLAILGALALVACGGGDDASTATATASSATTAAGTSSAAATSTKSSAATPDSSAAGQLAAINTAIPAGIIDGKALGKTTAKVTLTLYEDFQCPFCLKFNTLMFPTLVEYADAGKLRVEFKNFPILGVESIQSAVASECAASQGLFWPFYQRLYAEQFKAGQLTKEQNNIGRFSKDNLAAFLTAAGGKADVFTTCYGNTDSIAAVQADFTSGQTAGVKGTPGLLLNGKFVAAPADAAALKNLLDNAAK